MNNKYIDKVIGSLVRGTKIDYDKEEVYFPFFSSSPFYLSFFSFPPFPLSLSLFSKYCRNQFGLTEEEIEYVWEIYKDIIKDKISKREP